MLPWMDPLKFVFARMTGFLWSEPGTWDNLSSICNTWEHIETYLGFKIHSKRGWNSYVVWELQSRDLYLLSLEEYSQKHGNILRSSCIRGFPSGSEDKASASNVGHPGLIPGFGRSPGEGNGNPLQYSCLENPMGGGAW